MKKLIFSAIMFLSVAGMAVAQDTTGMKQHKAGKMDKMDKMDKKKSGDWKKGDTTMSRSGKMGGKMKKDSTNN